MSKTDKSKKKAIRRAMTDLWTGLARTKDRHVKTQDKRTAINNLATAIRTINDANLMCCDRDTLIMIKETYCGLTPPRNDLIELLDKWIDVRETQSSILRAQRPPAIIDVLTLT